jgi:hypothetical protein
MSAWRVAADGLDVFVRLTPRGGRDGLDGLDQLSDGRWVVKARVRAAPEDGKANEALRRLIAEAADVAPRAAHISAGATARLKTVRLKGEAEQLAAALHKRFAQKPS